MNLVGHAGLAPSKRESGTTHRIGDARRIPRQGSRWIRFTIVESAITAIMYDDRISKFYRRIASRRGRQKAKVASAKEMLVIIWHMLTKNGPYRTMNKDLVQRKYKMALDELGNHTGAIVYYDKASALDPKFVGLALSYKGAALLRLGKYSE